MRKSFYPFLAIAFWLVASLVVRADWPAWVFAPHMYIGAGDNFKTHQLRRRLRPEILHARLHHRPTGGSWHKYRLSKRAIVMAAFPWNKNLYHDQIDAIRKRGGDVIMSFGGEAGKEMANVIDDPAQLEAVYQKVIDQYKFTWLDFDVEGNNLDKGKQDSERRNSVLASLQKKNPGLIISYTLPVDPDGISEASQALLADAKAKGVKVHSANLMVMFFGKNLPARENPRVSLALSPPSKPANNFSRLTRRFKLAFAPASAGTARRMKFSPRPMPKL